MEKIKIVKRDNIAALVSNINVINEKRKMEIKKEIM